MHEIRIKVVKPYGWSFTKNFGWSNPKYGELDTYYVSWEELCLIEGLLPDLETRTYKQIKTDTNGR